MTVANLVGNSSAVSVALSESLGSDEHQQRGCPVMRALLRPENPHVDSRLTARRTTATVAQVNYRRESDAGL